MPNLQCPFSKCYPHLHEHYKKPCLNTPFHDYRDLSDHIWKYHSKLLSCDLCSYRFPNKRGIKYRANLNDSKRKHNEKCHSSYDEAVSPDSVLMIITMSEDDDEKFKKWKGKGKGKSKGSSVELKYQSLCRCLFGDSIRVPADISLDFMIPKYKLDEEYSALSQQNLADARRRQLAPPSSFATVSSSSSSSSSYQYPNVADPVATAQIHYHHHGGVNRLALEHDDDNNTQVRDWLVPEKPFDQDSGCFSGGDGFGNTPAVAVPDDGAHYPNMNQIPQYFDNDVMMGSYDWPTTAPGPSAEDAIIPSYINFDSELAEYDATGDGHYDDKPN